MNCSTPGFPVLHYLIEFAQIYFHWIGDAIQHLTPCHPLLFLPSIFPSIRVFSNEPALRIRWANIGQILYQLSHQGSPISFIMFWIYLWKPQCSRCMVPTAMAVDKSIHEKHGEWEGTRTRRETVELQCSVPRRKSWQQGWRSATMGECNQEQQFPETKKVPAKCKGAKSSGVQDGW